MAYALRSPLDPTYDPSQDRPDPGPLVMRNYGMGSTEPTPTAMTNYGMGSDRVSPLIPQSTPKAPVIAPVPQTEDQIVAAGGVPPSWEEKYLQPEPPPEKGFVGKLGQALGGGVDTLMGNLKATGNLYMGDYAGVEANANKAQEQAANRPKEQQAFGQAMAALPDNPGLIEGIKGMAGAIWEQPQGALQEFVAQAPNSAAVMGGMAAGGALGSAILPGIGTAVGAILGGFLGNLGIETGARLMESGADGLTPAEAKQGMSEGALKAAGVTGVDMATLGATRWLMGAPSRAASKAIMGSLTKSGVDVADDAAVSAAMQTMGVGSEALLQGARAMARATGRAPIMTLASAGLETVGEGAGEYLGEVMATGQGNMKEALLESIMAAPMSAGEIVWAKSDANQPFNLGTALERATGTDLSDPKAVDNYINTNLPHFAALSLDQDQLGIISKDEAMQALGNPNASPLQRINAVAGIAADIATRQNLPAVSEAWLERAKALMANGEVIKVPGYTQPIPAYQEQQKADRKQEKPITPPPVTTTTPKAEASVAAGLAPKPIIPNRMEEQQTTGMIPRKSPLEVSAPIGDSTDVTPEKQEVTAPIVATAPVPDATPERPPFVPTHTASDGVPVRQIQGNEFEDANGDIIVDDYADKLTPQEAQGMRRASTADIAKQLQEEQDSINARQQFAKTNDGIPFTAPMRNQPQKTVMVTPSAQQPGKWQITYLDKNGEPSGDSQVNSYSEAVDVAHQYGANWDQVALSGQPSETVAAQEAPPVATSSIEKPSSGMQQKLAQNREEAKQSPTTPALNRNEGESYRDWAARSWVALQTKPTDGSWDSSVIENTANRVIKPLAQKLDKGGWSTLDNLTPTNRGSRDPRRSISRHLEEMKQQGLVQIAWDNQGNSHWSKSGTSLPNWLTTSTDEQAIASLSPKPANAIQSRLQENRAQQEAQAAPAPWEMTKDEYVATTTPKDPRDASFTKAINRKDVEARGDGIYYVPAKVATPQFLNRLKTQQERASLTGRVTPTNQFEFKPWSEVTGDTTSAEASGYAILDRRARQNERIGNDHRAAVQQALAEGRSIPTSVLKDYPDLTVSQETANEPQAVETQPLAINPKKQTPIFTPDGKRFSAQWDVVEADSLSPTLTTGENQPRDRNRIGSDLQIQTIANNPDFKRLSDIGQTMDVGAPTMTREGVIVGGNGRVAGVTRSYNIGKAQGYRQALIDRADEFGADPAQIAGMSKPVLVRRLQEPVDTRAMALASNKPQGLAMGSTETAKVDAERMRNLGQIEVTDTGDIATNADNIAKLRDSLSDYDITEQAGFIDGTGNISADGLRRVRNAILHKAYGDSPVITRLLETADPDLKNVGTALVRAGGKMAEMNDVINRGDVPSDYAIATDVSQAIETLSQLRQNKVPLAEHLSQQNLFGEEHSPAEKRILQFLDENGRSAKAITSFLEDYADRVISSQGIGQDLFGITITPPTKDQVLTDVARSNTRTAPIPSGDLFTPTPAQQVASQPQDAGNNAPGNRVLGGETASGGVTDATTTAAVAPANTQATPIPQAAAETPIASPLDIKQAEKQLAMAKARVSSLTNRINRLGPNATNRAALEQRLSVAQSEADAAQAKTDAIRLPDQTAIPEAPAVSTKPPTAADLQYVKLNARDPVTKRIRDEDRGHMAVRYETPDGVINVGEIIDHRAAYGDTTTSQPWETSDGQRHMNLALAKKHELVTQVIPKLQRDGYLAPEAPPAAATARAPAPAVTNTPEIAPVNAAPSTEQQPTHAIAKTKVRTAYDLTDEEYKEVVADARYLKDVAYSIGNLLGNDKKAILRIGLSKNTRDTILMDALNIDRDLAHTINNGLDDKEIRNLRKQDMEEALVKFPMLKKLVDEHAPKPSATDKQAEAVTQGDDDDAAEAARRAVGLAAAGEYANSTIAEIMDGRASATIGDVALDGDTFGIVLKPNNTAGRLEIHLKPKTRPSFSVAWASNTQPFGKAMEALASNLTEGVQISLRENALGRAVAGKPDQEVAAEQAARQLFPVETAEQRQSLINRIIMTTPNELRGAVVRPNLEFEGRDGKWYGANGTPFNFQKTGKQRTAGYHLVNADGVGFGKRYATVAEAEDALRQQLQQRQDDLLKTLNGKSPEELFAAAKDALRADVQQQVARNEAQRQSEAKSAKAIAPNQQAAAVTEAELEDLQLFRKWGGRWQYKYMMGGNWMTANTQQDAMDRATKTYHKTPASERLTSQQRFDRANADEMAEMQTRYGHLPMAELQKQHAAMGGTIAELQEEGKREFNGNGGRRSGAAMAAQGARDTAEERSKLGRYIAWRQEQEQSKASLPDREIDSILPSDKPDSQSLLNDVLDEEFGATPVAKPRATRKPRAAKAPPVTKPTVAEAAGSAVKNFSEASTQALKGIAALFDPGNGTLGSGPVFNEDTWAKAKPLFVQAVQGYQASWQDIKEVIRAIVRALRELGLKREGVEAMSPYITRFADEVRDGVIILGGDNVQSTDTDAQGDSGATGDGGPSNQVHAEDGTGAAATASGRNGEQAGAEGIRPVGHRGLSGTGTAVEGEPGSDGLSRPDGELGDSQRTSRPGERDGGSRSSDTGVASGRQRAAAATGVTDAARALAEKTAITPAELDNIRTTLPQLLPSQQEDVQRAEQRFHTQNQLGMLFTNGTGTGKTFVGLGIVKRMARQGKTNIIITAPGEKIIDDWINAAKKFGLEIRKLADTKDAGQDGEIVITTYANFGQNDALVKRNWDLVVHDEAHYLMQDKDGTSTASLRKSRALTGHPDGALTYTEAMERDLVQQIADLKKASSFALTRERERLIEVLREREKAHAANRAELWKRKGTRRLDLSATPFAYETSIKAYEGFLFDFDRSQDNQGGYNKPNAFGDFMVRHFGWRMRTGKLTSPEASVDSGVMQRQFNRWLKQTGALSSRRLSVEQDYSREFIAVESLVGRQIDEGYDYIRERAYDRDNPLAEGYGMMLENLEERFPYHERIRLLEAIKAPFAVERARQHLALGRKVVIFHSRIQGGSVHPFKFSSGVDGGVYDRAIRDFKEQHPELVNLDLGGLTRPLDLLKNEFGDRVTFYNGTVSSKDKRNNPTKFNYDDGGVDVIVVQDDAGKEGISLHDTTGNKQRVLINIGLPIKPIQAIQIEGRIFRVGQASDAIFEYFNTGTTFERFTFATKISERASVAENMAMGDEARRLRDSFVDAFENPNDNPPSLEQGKGGKAADTAMESAVTPFQEAKTHYFANLKNTKRRDQREGIDYFATPEPLGLKMVEWSGMRPNDAVLEPSAGHGAIARYFPESVRATFVELSSELMSRLALRTNGKLRQQRFEDMDEAANKFDAIVMNPPYGTGGATARDHLAKAMNHLNNGGRIVALIPEGPAADAKFGALLYGSDNESVAAMKESLKKATGENATRLRQRIHQLTNFHVRASISLPPVVFERAGTAVKTRVLIIDRLDKGGSRLGDSTREIDATNIKDFFDRIEEMSVYDRPPSPMEASEVLANNGITVSEQDTGFYVMGTKYEQAELLRPIMRKHQGQWNGLSKYWFTTTDPSEDLAKALQGETVEGLVTEQPAPVTDNPDIISHTTQAGKVIRGVVRTDMNADQAKAIDPYTFRKNGGWFIREAHLSKLAGRDAPVFSKTKQPGTSGASPTAVRAAVSRITSKWANAPQVVVFTGMDDTQVDEAVRKEYARQTQERLASDPNAAPDQVDAFYYRGTVYINSESIANTADLERALRHETLGHAGLRALFGNSLNSILDQVISGQNEAVVAKAKQRGLNMDNTNEARTAAEEVLAELSETRPNLSVVRRAVALIRRLLRDMGVSLSLSNNDIIAEYLIPARNFIERSNPGYFGLSDALAFARRIKPTPQRTVKAYKLFRMDKNRPGELFPLFVSMGENRPIPIGVWEDAEEGKAGNKQGKVKSSIGELSYRPGWHAGDLPIANHIGGGRDPVTRKPTFRPDDQVWAEVELAADVDWQTEANSRGKNARDKAIADQIPIDGYYRYKTNPNMEGTWLIGGSMKVVRLLSDAEVKQINDEAGVADLPRQTPLDLAKYGFDATSNDIRFSLSPRQNTTLDSAWQKLNLAPEKQKTLTEHVQTLLSKNWRQAMTDFKANAYEWLFDGLINIDRAEKEVGITKPEQSGYVSARMATGIADTLWGVLNKGAPEWRNGVLAYKRGTKGLLTVLGDLGPDMRNWLGWMAGNRANELMAQGRENNLEQAEIDELLALATPAKAPKFLEAKAAYNALNSAMLDVAEQAGLIDPQSRSQWESEWYVPFYRQLEIDGDATLLGPRTTRGLSHQTSGIRALKGGSAPTADLLTNILTNWTKLVDASMKNHALSQVADNLNGTRFMVDETTKWKQVLVSKPEMIKRLKESPELVREMADWLGLPNGDIVYTLNEIKKMTRGEMEKLWTKVAPTDKEVIRIKRDGKNYYYRVLDPSLLRSIESFGFQGFSDPMTRTARTFKRLLTTGVTSMPDFIIRNFVRDAVHAWAINKDGMKFASDAVKGVRKTYGESDAYWDLVFSGGAFQGGYVHGTDPEASAQIVRRSLGRKGLSPTQIEARERGVLATKDRIIDVLDKYWERYRSWGDKAENINRLATYEAAIAAGKSPLQAAYEAKDLMDYSLRGNYQLLMRFTDMVPFLNARIQGLGKLGRAGMADPRIIGMKLAKIAAFSVALAMINGDDDRYKKLEDWEKDAYWHFWLGDQQFRIPKPFEIGVLAGTIPERMWNTFVTGNQENDKMWWSVKHNILGTFSFNPIPQVALPVIENVANRSFFFDRPIENMSDLGQLPFNRFESRTSDTMRVLGSWLGASPKQLEHLTQGYLGTLGSYVMFLSDAVVRWADGAPSKPDWTAADIPVLKSFFRGSGPARNTVYATDLFDAFKEVEMIHRTITDMRKEGRMEDAQALQARSTDKLRFRPQILSAKKRLDEIRRQIDIISGSSLSSTMKRQRIDRLTIEKNRLSERVANQIAPAF